MPKFIIKTGKYQGKALKLPERDITIGRDEECDIRVTDSDVSRKHCQLVTRSKKLFVIDLDSQNGTCVNDITIQEETRLKPGDLLRVGPMVFELSGTKKTVSKPTNHKTEVNEQLSDDDISSWLAVGDEDSEASPGDTTIIPSSQMPRTDSKSITPKEKKEFHSIAEEAADIIKKHWEKMAENKLEKN